MCSEVTEVPPGQCLALSCRLVEASAVDAGGVPTVVGLCGMCRTDVGTQP